jgi:putative membrane protein
MAGTRSWWPSEGDEPDPRWSLANERTVLAYSRTALAFLVAGVALGASRDFADTPWWLATLGVPLALCGGAIAWAGARRFVATQRAIRTGEPLGAPVAAAALPVVIAAIAVIAAAAVTATLLQT